MARLDGVGDITLFAPTDAAFKSLHDAIGGARFDRFMTDSAALTSWLETSMVSGLHNIPTLSYHAVTASGIATLDTQGADQLQVTFDNLAEAPSHTSVAVGPAGVDAQSYVTGNSVQFGRGVLIPVDHVFVTGKQLPSS